MSSISFDLSKIKGFVFDIDGVISPSIMPIDKEGNPIRMFNIKDHYAIQKALKEGFIVVAMSETNIESIECFLIKMGMSKDQIYLQSDNKKECIQGIMSKFQLDIDEFIYVGDDIPDLEIIKELKCTVAPADACIDILNFAKYISSYKGGEGVVRDVIEQVLRCQSKWNLSKSVII